MKNRIWLLTAFAVAACTVLPSVSSLACTTVLVGKGVSSDGSTIIARNEDVASADPKKVIVHQAETNPAGTTFESKVNGFKMELPAEKQKYTSTPEFTDESGVFEESGTNASGVAMSATESTEYNSKIKKADPLVKDGIGEECMVTVVLPYIHSAREGVTYLGDIVTKYGSSECNGVAFSDKNEIWYMEILSGHHWVAERIPDDKYAVIANQSSIRNVDLKDTDNYLADKDLESFVKDNKLNPSAKTFNIRKIFGTNNKDDQMYNICRVWDGQRLLTSSVEKKYKITSKKIPFLQTPDDKISVADVETVLRSHYNGTKYDPYKNKDSEYRPINVQKTVESHIIQWRQDMPVEISGIQWQALGTPEMSVYVPFYNGIDDTIAEYKNEASDSNPSYSNAYWIFKTTDVLATPYYNNYMKKYVSPIHKKIEKKLNENIEASDKAAMDMYNANPDDTEALTQYLTEQTNTNATYTLDNVKKLNAKMFVKSTDSRSDKHNSSL